MALPYRAEADGVRLFLRVTPNAGTDRIEGVERRDDGSAVLRVRVSAVPDKGKANAAAIGLLAKALGLPKSSISLVAGASSRFKTLHLKADSAQLAQGLAAWL